MPKEKILQIVYVCKKLIFFIQQRGVKSMNCQYITFSYWRPISTDLYPRQVVLTN